MTSPQLDEVRWGIIGCGNVCEKKAGPALYGVTGSKLIAVMRRNGELAADYAKRHHVPKHYDNVDAILADDEINCIYVATPDEAHCEMTLRAAEAGKQVLVEKAMAMNAGDCTRMIDTCQKQGVILAVAYYRRGYPTVLRAKQLIDEGAIGKVTDIWLNDEFPLSHRLDLFHFFNGDVAEVTSKIQPLSPCSAELTGPVLELTHHNGSKGYTNACWDENLVAETIDIRGTAGRIVVHDLKAGLLVWHDEQGKKNREELGPLPATHWGLVDNFVKHATDGTSLACDGVEGRKSTVILDIVAELQHDGTAVRVEY